MILRRGMGALVPAGTPYFPGQGPLLPTVIRTIAGREREGRQFGVTAYPRGLGGRGFGTNAVRRRGVRGLGDVTYCVNNPPNQAQQDYLQIAAIPWSLIDCGGTPTPQGANQGNQPVVTIANPNAAPGAAPVYQAPTDIEDCVSMGLATSAGQACVARNTARAVAAENAHLTDNSQYQTQLCIANGGGGWVPAGQDVGQWCAGNYGGVVPTTYSPVASIGTSGTPVPAGGAVAAQQSYAYSPVLHFLSSTGNAARFNVGDYWTVNIQGGAPNSPVTAVGGMNGAKNVTVMGSTDASGSFSLQGQMTADQIGSWQEQWNVGNAAAGFVAFTVNPAGSTSAVVPPNKQAPPVVTPPVVTPPVVTPPATTGTFDLGTFLTESVFMGIPNWILLAGVGGVVLLMGAHQR